MQIPAQAVTPNRTAPPRARAATDAAVIWRAAMSAMIESGRHQKMECWESEGVAPLDDCDGGCRERGLSHVRSGVGSVVEFTGQRVTGSRRPVGFSECCGRR